MFVKIKNHEEKRRVLYPYYGKSLDGTVVLFSSSGKGTLIKRGTKPTSCKLGEFSDVWAESLFAPMGNFTLEIIQD